MKEHTDKTQVVQNVKRQIEKKTLTLEEKRAKIGKIHSLNNSSPLFIREHKCRKVHQEKKVYTEKKVIARSIGHQKEDVVGKKML